MDNTAPVFSFFNLQSNYDTDGSPQDITLNNDGTIAYVADGSSGLLIIDVTTPSNPTLLGSIDHTNSPSLVSGNARQITLSDDGSTIFIATGDGVARENDLSAFGKSRY